MQLRVLIADDHQLLRTGVRALLERDGIEICGEASTGSMAVELAATLSPHVVVTDISMPDMGGIEATRAMTQARPGLKVLALSMYRSGQMIRDIVRAGARGYVLKSDAAQELVNAVRALAAGRPYFSASVSELLLDSTITEAPPAPRASIRSTLSVREEQVLRLVATGKSNKEVAATLNLSVRTAETHRKNIMAKLNLHSCSQLIQYAYTNRIITDADIELPGSEAAYSVHQNGFRKISLPLP